MTFQVRYHPDALAELRAHVAWYDDRGAGLGDRFETAIEEVVDTVVGGPRGPHDGLGLMAAAACYCAR